MIKIGKPYVYLENGFAYLKAKVDITEDTAQEYVRISGVVKKVHWRTSENYPPIEWTQPDSGLWFSVPEDYKEYLCVERGDAFLVAMLWYAMITGSDIESEAPLSEKMLFNITNFLIPALCTSANGYRRINIFAQTTDQPIHSAGGVGTGMSCGVDSFYTLHKFFKQDIPLKYRLTHLAYFNMGAIFHPNRAEEDRVYSLKEFYETTDRMSEEKRENARKVAELSGLPLVYVKSNLDSDYYRGAYGHTGVYRNCAMALSLQGLFSVYYNSSGGWPGYFDLSLTEGSQHYEALLCQCLSTESLSFILSDYVTRVEKTISIADDSVAQQFLDVCFRFNNCGECLKCRRTLLTLDLIDKVDAFGKVFDTEAFKRRRIWAYDWLLNAKEGDAKDDDAVFARDLYRLAVQKGKIPYEDIEKYRREKKRRGVKRKIKSLLRSFGFYK